MQPITKGHGDQLRFDDFVDQTSRNRAAYDLLGVQPGATQAQIRTAYRQKAREAHPDKGGSEAAMKKLNAAYQKLSKTK